jgi:regulator of sirC expression with transglutaminase-like and TPR domain
VPSPFADSPEFRRLLDGDRAIRLARIALEIARDARPDIDIDSYLARIDVLAKRARQRCVAAPKPRAVLGQIHWILFVEEGFRGNDEDYYDPRNSYLSEVLDRKLGIPISLSILYAEVAAQVGLELAGVNLPGHFVLRLTGESPPLFVDPYNEGAVLDRSGCERLVEGVVGHPVALTDAQIEPIGPALVVARMLRNLKTNHLRCDDYPSALSVVRRLAALTPNDLDEQRDWGLLAYRTGHAGESLAPLTRYVEGRADAPDIDVMTDVVRAVRREVVERN